MSVYLPHGYRRGKDRYPLLLVNAGYDWIESAGLPAVLDNLMSAPGFPPCSTIS